MALASNPAPSSRSSLDTESLFSQASSTETVLTLPQDVQYGLYCIANGGETPEIDVVLVHGLGGDLFRAWTERASKKRKVPRSHGKPGGQPISPSTHKDCFWPRELLARDFPTARILAYGYDSAVAHGLAVPANQNIVRGHGEDLLRRVANERAGCKGRPLIFVCHSLGGIVAEYALTMADEQSQGDELHDVYASTYAVMFFGTPHRGSDWVGFAKNWNRFRKVIGHPTADASLEILRPDHPALEELRRKFINLLDKSDKLHVTSYYETLGLKKFGLVHSLIVGRHQAVLDHNKEEILSRRANHKTICKFSTKSESYNDYKHLFRAQFKKHLQRAAETVRHSPLSIQGIIRSLSSEQRADALLRILRKTPGETRRETCLLLEFMLRTHKPVTLFDIASLLSIASTPYNLNGPSNIPEEELAKITASLPALHDKIRNLSGGLLTLVPPTADWDHQQSQYPPSSRFQQHPISLASYRDDQQSQSPPSSRFQQHPISLASYREVQFLSQTVKDSLLSAATHRKALNTLLNSGAEVFPDEESGHILHLRLAEFYLNLNDVQTKPAELELNAVTIVEKHAPAMENFDSDYTFRLLKRIDKRLSQPKYWSTPQTQLWHSTFLSFAVSHRMHSYVRRALSESSHLISSKTGRPLLHYAAWAPGTYPDERMAEILLANGADVNASFKEAELVQATTALESMLIQKESHGETCAAFINFLVQQGAKVSNPIPADASEAGSTHWTTVLHLVITMDITWPEKMDIFKSVSEKFDSKSLNVRRFDNLTMLDLFERNQRANQGLTHAQLKDLLHLGARITPHLIREIHNSHSIIYSKDFRQKKFWMLRARIVAARKQKKPLQFLGSFT